ncbi:hypothetical protein, partial [Xylanibacter rodentium]
TIVLFPGCRFALPRAMCSLPRWGAPIQSSFILRPYDNVVLLTTYPKQIHAFRKKQIHIFRKKQIHAFRKKANPYLQEKTNSYFQPKSKSISPCHDYSEKNAFLFS